MDKKEEFGEEYQRLVAKLPQITPPVGGKDDEKAQELLRQADEIRYYEGGEDSGLNESIDAEKRQLRKETKKYCLHEWKTTVKRDMTQDARLRITRMIECVKCGMAHRDVVEEEVKIR